MTIVCRGALLALALVLVLAPAAAAHVTVSPDEVAAGSFAKLTFRVPNEREGTSTVEVAIAMPGESIEDVGVQPVAGWDHDVEREGGTVTAITWSGGAIAPGEFQEFSISIGPVPDGGDLVFPALQVYDDGEVVRWIETAGDGEDEPDSPAPVVAIGDEDAEEHEVAATGGGDEDGTEPVAFVALVVAGAALVAAVAALIFGPRRVPA